MSAGQRWRSLIGNLSRRSNKRRRPTAGTMATSIAHAEQTWATAPNLQFLIHRGLTPREAYITFRFRRDEPSAFLRRYALIFILYPGILIHYGAVLRIAVSGVLFVLLTLQNIILRRSQTNAINRLIAALEESLEIFISPTQNDSYDFFLGERGDVMRKSRRKARKLRKLAFRVAEELAVLNGSPRRDAGNYNYSGCARVILWSADRLWDKRRVAQAVDTIIEQLKHILGPNPRIPLRFAVRNDFPELSSRSQRRRAERLVKALAAPLLVTVAGAIIAAILRIFIK
jgi:hypothetical protein